jgi:hypothetical protein
LLFYAKVIRRIFGPAGLYGHRVIKVEQRAVVGAAWQFEQALRDSEDLLNTEYTLYRAIESYDPTGLAYLFRRTICHVRWEE